MPAVPSDPTPSLRRRATVMVSTERGDVDAFAIAVDTDHDVPAELGADRQALQRSGFRGLVGQALCIPRSDGACTVAVGVGSRAQFDTAALRNAAAAFASAVPEDTRLAFTVPTLANGSPNEAAAAIVEGVLLSRYSFNLRGHSEPPAEVSELQLLTDDQSSALVQAGATRGHVVADATRLCRDLANSPGSLLTAAVLADTAVEVAGTSGLEVEVFDRAALLELGCGGLLGVNRGSADEPRMVRLRYRPENPSGHLTLVGKGIMYDSGGISLKPSDAVHATMKNDMTGAAAVLAAMTTLDALNCRVAVTGYLMCTDNMPSGSALKLGDVITMRGGRTVEVLNTDAEGRLVMADALVLAAEEPTDAIVDIATLTGACLRTFGTEIAGVLGNNQALVDQLKISAEITDEPVWQLPLTYRYRNQLDSPVADLSNMGGINAGTITAALFLAEFVGDRPWAHIDIAGTAQADFPYGWVNQGATGSGTRLLIDLAMNFVAVAS
ncbi:leucyl aminopeptidase [Jatrophihabitans sp. DSM 45814]